VIRSSSWKKVRGVPRWLLIAAPLVLAGELVISMAVRFPAEVTAAPSLRPPPSTTGTDLEGRSVSLGSMRGAPLVVSFFASWCGPCREDASIFTSLANRYRERVEFISVAVGDDPHDVRVFAAQHAWTWSVILDDRRRWVEAFGPPGVPTTFVLNAEGVVTEALFGPVTEGRLASTLDALVPSDGAAVSVGAQQQRIETWTDLHIN
jgi:cytochrome c biogenesis protein CcmG, thiol:disulfide interchange protein DsbE